MGRIEDSMFVASVTGEGLTRMAIGRGRGACWRLLFVGTRRMKKLLVIMSCWTLALYFRQALVLR